MLKNLAKKFLDASISTLPISLAVIVVSFFFPEINAPLYAVFAIGTILLIIGLALFSLGIDMGLSPIGREVGSNIAKSKKLSLLIIVPLLLGLIITIAEPGVTVLSGQLTSDLNTTRIITYSLATGVGIFLLVSVLRIFFNLNLRYVFLIVYGIMLILAALTQYIKPEFVSVALDAGGVTTGAITVPFLMSFTVGIAKVTHGKKDSDGDESFGTIALCTTGPVIVILILALSGAFDIFNQEIIHNSYSNFVEILIAFGKGLTVYLKDVAISLLPIAAIFGIFQIFALKLKKMQIIRIIIGLLYSYLGLSLFLTGVNIGFLPIGKLLGALVALSENSWLLVPLGIVIGALIVLAEPSVHALTKQVNELTSGVLSRKLMLLLLCIGVSFAVGISLLRVLTGISIWWFILPIYGLCLILTFFAPKLFTAIAFDSGGVASGPMTVTFALPFVIGACTAYGGNVFINAFGVVAMVSLAPVLVIMLTGMVYKYKVRKAELSSELESLPEVKTLPSKSKLATELIVDFDSTKSTNLAPIDLSIISTEIIDSPPQDLIVDFDIDSDESAPPLNNVLLTKKENNQSETLTTIQHNGDILENAPNMVESKIIFNTSLEHKELSSTNEEKINSSNQNMNSSSSKDEYIDSLDQNCPTIEDKSTVENTSINQITPTIQNIQVDINAPKAEE